MIWLALAVTIVYVLTTTTVLATPQVASPRRSVVCYLVTTFCVALVWFTAYGYYNMRVPA